MPAFIFFSVSVKIPRKLTRLSLLILVKKVKGDVSTKADHFSLVPRLGQNQTSAFAL